MSPEDAKKMRHATNDDDTMDAATTTAEVAPAPAPEEVNPIVGFFDNVGKLLSQR